MTIQESMRQQLHELLVKVGEGFYGQDNDFNMMIFEEDLRELTELVEDDDEDDS